MTEKLSQDDVTCKELSDKLDAEKAACDGLKTQLLEKESQSFQLLEQMKTLNEQLDSMQLAHRGTVFHLTD